MNNPFSILLINSPTHNKREIHYAECDRPCLALGYLAAVLSENNIDVKIIDAKFQRLSFSDVMKSIALEPPDVVGFTAMTNEVKDTAHLARRIKTQFPGIFVIVGGPHVSALPAESLLEFEPFDGVVIGEGEHAFLKWIICLQSGTSFDEVSGIAFRKDNEIIVNPSDGISLELDAIPFPRWDLLPRAKTYPVITSRGCPFKCNFCMRVCGRHCRKRSPENIINEIREVISRYSPEKLVFNDDTFGLDKKWSLQLLDLFIHDDMFRKVKWEITTRVDTVDEVLLKKIKQAGCSWIGFGIESGNDEILKKTQKGITLEKAIHAVTLSRRLGLNSGSFFIMGHPYETVKTLNDTVNFAAKLPTNTVSCGIMVPYPGTEIYDMAKRGEGNYRLISNNWNDYNKQIGNALEFNNLARKQLEHYQFMLYFKFYVVHFRFNKIKSIFNTLGMRNVFYTAWHFLKSTFLLK